MISRTLLAMTVVTAAGCDGLREPGDTTFEVVFDPCELLVVVPRADTTAEERESVAAAIAMWNERAATRLTLDEVPRAARLPIGFDEAPGAFYGVYEDEVGRVLINRNLADPVERTITIAHELGHAFGLFHVARSERASVMNTANLTIDVQEGDAEALRRLWGSCDEGAPRGRAVD